MSVGQYARYPVSGGSGQGIATYANQAALPTSATDGAAAVTLDTDTLYIYNAASNSWKPVADPATVNSITPVGSTPNANGGVIAGRALTLEPADGTHPGLITSGAQTLGGAKTFTGAITASNLSGTNSGDVTLGTAGSLSLSGQVLSQSTGNLTDVGTDGIVVTGGTGAVNGAGTSIAQTKSDATHNGYLSSTDWSTFNNKQAALTTGNLTDVGTDGIVITGGTGAVIGTGTSIAQTKSDTTHNGYLASTDFTTFNNKQAAGNYITALTGDVTASGPGSAASTLATVATAGTNTKITYNAKGLVTSGASATLASADYANQGTTTTVLHGNAAGNPSWGAVNLATDTTGSLGVTQGGTGQSSYTTGDTLYASATNTLSKLSVGTANQVYQVLGSNTVPSWQRIYQYRYNNYIFANPNAQVDTTGWATYSNTAANIPSTGTGGTATGITFSRTTSTPLRGIGSFLIVQTNSTNIQGKGVSYDFTIDPADQAQVLGISFDYNATSTFVASDGTTTPLQDGTTTTNAGNSDVEVFLYDKTNAVLIPVNVIYFTGNGANNYSYSGTFQTANNSTSYRLIFHVATANANATGWQFKFDNLYVGKTASQPTGSLLECEYYASTNGTMSATSPLNFDTKITDTMNAVTTGAGAWKFTAPVAGTYQVNVMLQPTSAVSNSYYIYKNGSIYKFISFGGSTGTTVVTPSTTVALVAGDYIDIRSGNSVTYSGSSGQSSNSCCTISIYRIPDPASVALTTTVAARYHGSSTTISGTLATVVWTTADYDTNSGMSSGVYTIPVSGKYQINLNVQVTGTIALNTTIEGQLQVNGTVFADFQSFAGGAMTAQNCQLSTVYSFTAGQALRLQLSSTAVTPTISSTTGRCFIDITKVG